ncbi:unnamed protein product [Larinioides sclopetarius]|uniref:USP domain-containing protein n=1 Tax=Larinioides sclopetarius TaxID=280406 RepID=A0AAV2BM02_9ARAC
MRLTYTSKGISKLMDDVKLEQYLRLNSGGVSQEYKLRAFIVHYGNFGSRHYKAFTKISGTDTWACFSDSFVSTKQFKNIEVRQAYILFYEISI